MSLLFPHVVRGPATYVISYSDSIAKRKRLLRDLDVYDLSTFDGFIQSTNRLSSSRRTVIIAFENIQENFRGFFCPHNETHFCLKSSLQQLGIVVYEFKLQLNANERTACIEAELVALGPLAILSLDYVTNGCYIGKLFCADNTRRIKNIKYIQRLRGRNDIMGEPLFVSGTSDLDMTLEEREDGRVINWLNMRPGVLTYDGEVTGLLPTIGCALKVRTAFKDVLRLHQVEFPERTRLLANHYVLIVRSNECFVKTMFAKVAEDLLPTGVHCQAVLEPASYGIHELARGRTFIFYGESDQEIVKVPLEYFALEPYRESLAFNLRRTLPRRSHDAESICRAFTTMPVDAVRACTFICKGSMFDTLKEADWIATDPIKVPYVGVEDPEMQQQLTQRYLYQQCEYGILSALAIGDITSEGILLTRYFPSVTLKSLLLSYHVHHRLHALYFSEPSGDHGFFFSQEDQALLVDLVNFGIIVIYVDLEARSLYQFLMKPLKTCGMFVPLSRCQEYLQSTTFGVYGSNLLEGDFEQELKHMLSGLLEYRKASSHPLMNPDKPLSVMTGGGPGAMAVGNRVAKYLGILSCGLFVDFGSVAKKRGSTINEQNRNECVEAFMTYRADKLIERQSDFMLDFPIFLAGGIGTDFEYALEELRRKVCIVKAHPMILFGSVEHWGGKITGRFQQNLKQGTIKGSEWISNIPWVVNSGKKALAVLTRFFDGTLPTGPMHPGNERGFMVVGEDFMIETGKMNMTV